MIANDVGCGPFNATVRSQFQRFFDAQGNCLGQATPLEWGTLVNHAGGHSLAAGCSPRE
jgi:hypothetical protein